MKPIRFIIHVPALILIPFLGMIAALVGWESAEEWLCREFTATIERINGGR
jgi:hypothetical protein